MCGGVCACGVCGVDCACGVVLDVHLGCVVCKRCLAPQSLLAVIFAVDF